MKPRTTIFLAAILAVFIAIPHAFSQAKGKVNAVSFTAHLKGLLAGKKVYYAPDDKNFEAKKDSLITEAGSFTLKIDIPEGQGDLYKFRIGTIDDPLKTGKAYLESGTFEITSPTVAMDDSGALISGSPFGDQTQDLKEFMAKTLQPLGMGAIAAIVPTVQQWIVKHPESPVGIVMLEALNEGKMISDEDAGKIIKKAKKQALNNVRGRKLLERFKANKDKAKDNK